MFLSGKISLFKVAKVKYFLEINSQSAISTGSIPTNKSWILQWTGKGFLTEHISSQHQVIQIIFLKSFKMTCVNLFSSLERKLLALSLGLKHRTYLPYKICETMQCKCNHSLQFFSTQPTSACNTGSLVCKYCSENAVILKCNIWTPTSYKGSKVFLRKLPTYDSEAGSLWTWATWELL